MECQEVPIQQILGSECIGDSRAKINTNFAFLQEAICGVLRAPVNSSVVSVSGTDPIFVENPTTTPIISLGLVPSHLGGAGTVYGILQADGLGNVSRATPGVDYLTLNNFANLKDSTGWQKLPGGLIIQWGKIGNYTSQQGNINVSFPLSFLSACVSVQVSWKFETTYNAGGAGDTWAQVVSFDRSKAILGTQNATTNSLTTGSIMWLAIGY